VDRASSRDCAATNAPLQLKAPTLGSMSPYRSSSVEGHVGTVCLAPGALLRLPSRSSLALAGCACLALLGGLVAAYRPLLGIGAAVVALVLLVAVARPELALSCIALLIPSGHILDATRIWILGSFYETLFQLLVLALGIIALFKMSARGRTPRVPGILLGASIAVAGSISAVGSQDLLRSFYWVLNAGILIAILSSVITERLASARRAVHLTLITTGALVAGLAIAERVMGHAVLGSVYAGHVLAYEIRPGYVFRPLSTVGNPLVMGSSLVGIYALTLTTPYLRRGRLPLLAVLAAGVIGSVSRSPTGILIATTAIWALPVSGFGRSRFSHGRAMVIIAVVPALTLAVTFSLPMFKQRTNGQLVGYQSDQTRAQYGNEALNLFEQQPVVGAGLGGFKRQAEDKGANIQADNMYLTLLAETGAVGGTLVVGAGVYAWRHRRALSHESYLSVLPVATMLASSFFFETLYHDATVFVFALLLADACLPLTCPANASKPSYIDGTSAVPEPTRRQLGAVPRQSGLSRVNIISQLR
jgi:O-Antigen ligase